MRVEVSVGPVSVEVGQEGFDFVVQAWDHLINFVSVVLSSGDVIVRAGVKFGDLEEKFKKFNCICPLCSRHTDNVVQIQDGIHIVLIILCFAKYFVEPVAFPGVCNDHINGFVSDFLKQRYGCR